MSDPSRGPALDPRLPERIRAALAGSDSGTEAYLDLGARLDRVSDVEVGTAAVAWRSIHAHWDRPWLIAMGADAGAVAGCVAALLERTGRPEGLTVARDAFPRLRLSLRPTEHTDWDWWFTTRPPDARPGQCAVVALRPDDPRIDALLDVASPDPMVRPGDRRIRGWFGIEDAGDLVAVAASVVMRAGIPHLASVATHPGWRGRGLARDLCAQLTQQALAGGAPAVTLGTYAANAPARTVYESLGYRIGYRWASGRLDPVSSAG